jgi:hypothetical protein
MKLDDKHELSGKNSLKIYGGSIGSTRMKNAIM